MSYTSFLVAYKKKMPMKQRYGERKGNMTPLFLFKNRIHYEEDNKSDSDFAKNL